MTPEQEALLRWLDAKADSLRDDSLGRDQWEFADPTVLPAIRKACAEEATKYQQIARALRAALADAQGWKTLAETNATIASVAERNMRAALADAERYRWLRDGFVGADFNYGEPPASVITFYWPDALIGADLDKSIDAARAGKE